MKSSGSVHDDAETEDEGGEVVPLLMLEAIPSPSPEKSLKKWLHSEKSVEVGLERTKHALREEVGEGGGLVLVSETLNDWGLYMNKGPPGA
jgi:hypothetical protein